MLAPDVGIATRALPRGAPALASIEAVTAAWVVGGRAAAAIAAAPPPEVGGRPAVASAAATAPLVVGGRAAAAITGARGGQCRPINWEGRKASVFGGSRGAGTYCMGDHLREVVQIFSEAGCARQKSMGTWGPGGRRPAGHWRGLRERAGRDADVGGQAGQSVRQPG